MIDWSKATRAEIISAMKKVREELISRCGPSTEPDLIGLPSGWYCLKPTLMKGRVKKGPGQHRQHRIVMVKQ